MTTNRQDHHSSLRAGSFELPTPLRAVLVLGLIYLFLLGVTCLEEGIGVMGGDAQEQLFSRVSNPLAALFVGMLATVLVQSSSATTSIIVGLVASGALGLDSAVYMVMGANLGTTVTNTLVSLGHVRKGEEFRRAFAAATVHDFFNVFTVLILFPVELATGWLQDAAAWLSGLLVGTSGAEFDSPIKAAVEAPVEALIDSLDGWITGTPLGVLLVVMGLVIILLSLTLITKNMRTLVADRVERSLNAMLGKGGGVMAMLLGVVITMSVQSSSITTSILIPLCAAGVLSLRNAYPVTLGANVGTTITALLAAMAASSRDALTIALVHTLFNVGGILLIYPLPFTRELPIRAAERLAGVASRQPRWAIGYVFGTFIVVPLAGIFLLG
jgi:solute carrier family 34 (sodium-dependent phosphate cotransporter)